MGVCISHGPPGCIVMRVIDAVTDMLPHTGVVPEKTGNESWTPDRT